MSKNPFLEKSALNLPLQQETCQRIHFAALQGAVNGLQPDILPSTVSINDLVSLYRIQGGDAYLAHPAYIEHIFYGVTLEVFRAIEFFLCQRLGRSIRMVARILEKMAIQAEVQELDYEAVWSICLFLKERRQDSTAVSIVHDQSTWQIIQLSPEVGIEKLPKQHHLKILCVLASNPSRVLSFRITDNFEVEEAAAYAIYDAIISKRTPSPDGAAGLTWQLPTTVSTDIGLSSDTCEVLSKLNIELISEGERSSSTVSALQSDWYKDLAGRVLQKHHFAMIFDNYLQKIHGFGPILNRQRLETEFAHLIGYNRDPAWQFPTLQQLLPKHRSVIDETGTVECNGLHYENELLAHWPGTDVTIRISAKEEAVAWIYLEGEILCQAIARELRRTDGSYRPNRPERD